MAQPHITPRIILHGGAGNITRSTIPKEKYDAYQASLLRILSSSTSLLQKSGATALDVATFAVSQLEDDALYNSGKGAVFTRDGQNELECSVMVSNGYRKRGVGCMMLSHVKNPIKLARELLLRGERDRGGGAQDHCQYSGAFVEKLAREWELEMVEPSYFFTQQRWDEHVRGLEEEGKRRADVDVDEMSEWEKANYIPLGTCGAVVLDSFGTICAATSTGGLTNKVPGRVGDTPTLGAGFWAEEWFEEAIISPPLQMQYRATPQRTPLDQLSRGAIGSLMGECFLSGSSTSESDAEPQTFYNEKPKPCTRRAMGISGTGNGDSFLRLSAASTAANRSRFASTSLADAVRWMAGPQGELQNSAGERWGRSHEGTGGMIGIEVVGEKGEVVFDFNCGGMIRAWVDEDGEQRFGVFREEGY